MPLIFFLFLYAQAAIAAQLSILPVGDFGGYRVKAACLFGDSSQLCTLDTMGSVSVISDSGPFARYAVTGHEKVSGIGQALDCDVVDVTDLQILGTRPAHFSPLRCHDDNAAFPLVGLPFFGRRAFLFDFPAATLTWDTPAPVSPKPLLRIGAEKLWIAMPAMIGSVPVVAAFDTGNPVTIVNRAFVDAHPELFRPSLRPISPGLAAKGLLPFDILESIVVEGVALEANQVYAGAKYPAPFFEQAALILGMNHAAQARWWFDLGHDLFGIVKP